MIARRVEVEVIGTVDSPLLICVPVVCVGVAPFIVYLIWAPATEVIAID